MKHLKPKRILIATREFPPGPGGIGHYALNVGQHLHSLGWDVSVVATQQHVSKGEALSFDKDLAIRVFRVGELPVKHLTSIWRLIVCVASIIRRRPSLLMAAHPYYAYPFALLGRFFRLPVVAVGYGSEYLLPPGFRRKVYHAGFRRVDGIINISRYTRTLMDEARIDPPSSITIPCGANHTEFTEVNASEVAALRERLGLEGKRTIVSLGMVSERKAQDVVIRAMPDILRVHPNLVYVVAGRPENGEILDQYKSLSRDVGVERSVLFVGQRPRREIPLVLALCDLLVLSSRTSSSGSAEGFGMVAVEAAFLGKPSVVSQGCGSVEAIDPGITGLAVPPNDPHATAEAIIALLSDDAMRVEMGRRAQDRALGTQTWDRVIVEYDQYLSEVGGIPGESSM